jgi:Putative Actinobacterial Holin-X, holin superfamily III
MADRPLNDEELRRAPTGELIKQLAEETTTLVRQEIALARAEMITKTKRAGIGLGELGGAGIVALYALGALTACIIAALALALPVWAAALIVAVVYAAIAGALALTGRRQLQENVPPTLDRTEKTMKENVEWAKTQKP